MLDLNALKQALAPLSKVGRDEHSFDIGGQEITICPLLPLEEVMVQRYAASVLDDIQAKEGLDQEDQMSRAAALDYFDRFRIEIIAHSVVQVGALDLREIKNIPTGEVLDNGVAVQVPKAIAMRGIVEGWSRAMITVCFARYGDLVQKIADAADKIAQTTLPDLDAEIGRVEARLGQLKEDRETRAKGDPSVTTQQITSLVRAGRALEEEAETAALRAKAEILTRKAAKRKPVTPSTSPPPSSGPVAPPPLPPEPDPVYRTSPAPTVEPPDPTDFQSSFGDGDDPQALAVEEQRILAARAAASAAWRASEPPPEPVDALRNAQPAGTVGGIEAYRLPSENLSPRGREGKAPRQKEAANPESSDTKNPNFKPPQ